MVYFLLFWLSSIRTSVSFLASSQKQQSVCGPSSKFWARVSRAGEILQPCTSWDLQRSQTTRIKAPPKPAQQLPSSAQATAEAGQQLGIANNSAAEKHPRSAGGQQLLDWLPQPSSASSRAHPACLPCPAGMLACVVRT